MRYEQEEIQYLLLQQKRYKKLIKSYQRNDVSKEYTILKQKNEKLVSQISDLKKEIIALEEKMKNQKKENEHLLKQNKQLQQKLEETKASDVVKETTDFLQSLVADEISVHFLAIYHLYHHWISLNQQTTKEVYKMIESNPNHSDDMINKNNAFPLLSKPADNEGSSNKPSQPKPFHFKDLQSYKKAYILPEKKKTITNHEHLLPQSKMKNIKERKEDQLNKSNHLDLSNKEVQLDHLEESNKPTIESVNEPSEERIESAEKNNTLYTSHEADIQVDNTKTVEDKKSAFRRFLDRLMN
ncbi:hypothetical protein BN1058_02737 [Paraliobacillus sp. PM-2]|uniref:hypothetical protein n=1 Tax=Paraliobacillus sp. PM-2 TaxID=1462524 RepID=UPI00061BFCEF|nr:hypothetical protein [Paraliobacillus sp. PM-2]CQR48369.1 hypothetical protein BN1058_02737 [Paraliobacillus sp. PM-2]